ncbi:MAG: flavoprotein [Planctomycetaceae bacterium]|nr:phosphopantothenoylcysteine decarboxylase [Planctomycetaceae bacterium]
MAKSSDKTLSGYEVLLCVSGGIACYKTADLASSLVQAGAGVNVAMTDSATQFIGPITFQSLTGRRVYTSMWIAPQEYSAQHIALTELADLMVIAPATADILAKMACGLADNLVSTLALSAHGACPILAAPAMNTRMWTAPAMQDNMKTLISRGLEVVGPAEGRLACGTIGNGRMSEPDDIFQTISDLLRKNPPKNRR